MKIKEKHVLHFHDFTNQWYRSTSVADAKQKNCVLHLQAVSSTLSAPPCRCNEQQGPTESKRGRERPKVEGEEGELERLALRWKTLTPLFCRKVRHEKIDTVHPHPTSSSIAVHVALIPFSSSSLASNPTLIAARIPPDSTLPGGGGGGSRIIS